MTSAIDNTATQPQDTYETEDILFVPRCSTPISDPCRIGGRRVFYLAEEDARKPVGNSSEYNDWKKRLQSKKSSGNFKVRGSVPGVKKLEDPNNLPHPQFAFDSTGSTKNCSIISGHFELELVPSRISEETIARPEPVYQMQWFPVPHPQFLANNCQHHFQNFVYYNGGNIPYIQQPRVHYQHQGTQFTSGMFFNGCIHNSNNNISYGIQYPANYYSCVPKPQLIMSNYTPHYNYTDVQRQLYYHYNPRAFIAYAAARAETQSNLYPNYVPVQAGRNSYGLSPQPAFSPVMMTS